MFGRVVAGIACLVMVACSGSKGNGNGVKPGAKDQKLSLFFTTELRGTIEPCGCTSDPMGDLARTAALIADARKGAAPVLVFDGGSTLYSVTEIPKHLVTQEKLKSALLLEALQKKLEVTALGLGPYDLAVKPTQVTPPRHAVNMTAGAGVPLAQPRIVDAKGAKVGVFGVVSPQTMKSHGYAATDPVPAAINAVAALKAKGAQLIVSLAHMTRREAADLARKAPGIDLMLIGLNAPEPPAVRDSAKKVGSTWMFRPANRGQSVVKIDVTLRGAGALVDAMGPARAKAELTKMGERLDRERKELAGFEKDPNADRAFVDKKRKELAELEAERKKLAANPLQVPTTGSYFVFEQVRIKKSLACDPSVVASKRAFDRAAGDANVKAAAAIKPPKPAKGKAGYSGIGECEDCHSKAVKFWKTTRHHQAWETLEKLGKEFSFDCIGCHVTGWEKPGGSTLGHNKSLRDVQCEVCHGPGSLHIDADGQDKKPRTVVRLPGKEVCVACHSPEHSDTFDYEAYLRDVTGPGHGATFRKKLGDGPTGHALRSAALKKAGSAIGAGCPK